MILSHTHTHTNSYTKYTNHTHTHTNRQIRHIFCSFSVVEKSTRSKKTASTNNSYTHVIYIGIMYSNP